MWRQPSLVAGERSILLRVQLIVRLFPRPRNRRLEAPKGFRVWPSGWQPLEANLAFSAFARQQKHPRLLGYLCTTWGKVKIPNMPEWPPVTEVMKEWKVRE